MPKLLQKYAEIGAVKRRPGSGKAAKVDDAVKTFIETQMELDDETTATQLQNVLAHHGHKLSLRTMQHCRTSLGWTHCGSAYCQLIRDANKTKKLAFAPLNLRYSFEDIIYTDECTVQMETHRFCCRKKGRAPHPKPRFVHRRLDRIRT